MPYRKAFALQPCEKKPLNFGEGLGFLIKIRTVLGAEGLAGFLI